MTSILQPPVEVLSDLPSSCGPLAVCLKTLTVRPALHSALPERTAPWKNSVWWLYATEIVLGTAADAAIGPASAMIAAASPVSARRRIVPPPARWIRRHHTKKRPLTEPLPSCCEQRKLRFPYVDEVSCTPGCTHVHPGQAERRGGDRPALRRQRWHHHTGASGVWPQKKLLMVMTFRCSHFIQA